MIAFLDVIEPSQFHTTLHALLDRFRVIFLSSQRLKSIVADDPAVANHAYAAVPLDIASHDTAASDRSRFADAERPQDHGHAQFDFLFFRFQSAFESGFDVVGDLVNDIVASDFNLDFLCQISRAFFWNDVESDDHRARGLGQANVGDGDSTPPAPAGF